ncbi:hypothetical protein L195_g048952, partial [Trifolium pratense]
GWEFATQPEISAFSTPPPTGFFSITTRHLSSLTRDCSSQRFNISMEFLSHLHPAFFHQILHYSVSPSTSNFSLRSCLAGFSPFIEAD